MIRHEMKPIVLVMILNLLLFSQPFSVLFGPSHALADEDAGQSTTGADSATASDIPMVTRRKLVHDLSSGYLVFIDRIQVDLKVTAEQKRKLDQYLGKLLPDAMRMLQRIKELTPADREAYDQNLHDAMAPVLQEVLNESQRTRLSQLERQREGLFGHRLYLDDLKVTDAQRTQFLVEVRQTRKKIQDLMGEIHNPADADEVRSKALQARKELEERLEFSAHR